SLLGVAFGESFTVTQTSGAYNSKNVLNATTVTANLSAGDFTPGVGTSASNYLLPSAATGPGQITALSTTIANCSASTTDESCSAGVRANNKPYNGGTVAAVDLAHSHNPSQPLTAVELPALQSGDIVYLG